ncbi:hypothetical protein N7582_000553 [Saccharomyces uvarum]|uniref:Decapping nuclease n=1 Tax=Saccharomyces uvarum TaxID=230603 RepID=A0AA35JCS6_SACUV|nr:hypothetical protein N7582_000553 [Saccharomyces uvarum]CAI4056245.1 hypothetical protein SUVC_02G4840 [Saccharomyces uvarum]
MSPEQDGVVKLAKDLEGINLRDVPNPVNEHRKKSSKRKIIPISSLKRPSSQQKNDYLEEISEFTRVPYSSFLHTSIRNFPTKPPPDIFYESKEVALFTDNQLYVAARKDVIPNLKEDISHLYESPLLEARKLKTLYLGLDLFANIDELVPMTISELDTIAPCISYIEDWRLNNSGKPFKIGKKFTVVTTRHHIVDLTMHPFDRRNKQKSIIATYMGNGFISLSRNPKYDHKASKEGIYSGDPNIKKICHSGFEFENCLTENTKNSGSSASKCPVFSIVEGKLSEDIGLLMRCEMDAFNPVSKTNTELKCFGPLSMQNSSHRKKLLKTWIQTGLLPNSDIMVGLRDSYSGQLLDIQWYSRDTLFRKFNHPGLPLNKKEMNYNAKVAVEWCKHCIKSICDLVEANISRYNCNKPEPFEINIDANGTIIITKLSTIPRNVEIFKT